MIDKKKFEVCMAIAYLFQNHHMMGNNLHWYYNPHSNLFEPIFREVHPVKTSDLLNNKCSIGSMTKFLKNLKTLYLYDICKMNMKKIIFLSLILHH